MCNFLICFTSPVVMMAGPVSPKNDTPRHDCSSRVICALRYRELCTRRGESQATLVSECRCPFDRYKYNKSFIDGFATPSVLSEHPHSCSIRPSIDPIIEETCPPL